MRRLGSKASQNGGVTPPAISGIAKRSGKMKRHRRVANFLLNSAPLLGIAATVLLSVLPGTSITKATSLMFNYAEIAPIDIPEQENSVTSASLLLSENKFITFILFLYMPVVYLWKATGRLSKEGGKYIGENSYILPLDELDQNLRNDPFNPLHIPGINHEFGTDGGLPSQADCSAAKDLLYDDNLCQTFESNWANIRRPLQWATIVAVWILPLLWGDSHRSIWKRNFENAFDIFRKQFTRSHDTKQNEEEDSVKIDIETSSDLPDSARDIGQSESCAATKNVFADPCSDPRHTKVLKAYNRRFTLYRKIPLKSMSRAWGRFNQLVLPEWLRSPAFSLYVWLFGCRLDEAANPNLRQYRNLSEFFRRKLRPGVRPIARQCLTSPADGRILHHGLTENGVLEQVKGVTYSLSGFLGPLKGIIRHAKGSSNASHIPRILTQLSLNSKNIYDGDDDDDDDFQTLKKTQSDADLETISSTRCDELCGNYCCHDDVRDEDCARQLLVNPENVLYHCIVYLAPGDYHRFHSPTDWTIYHRRHFPGELFSVKPSIARWLQGLFNLNERALYSGRWRHGFFSMTAVGATNVGSINVYIDPELTTNSGEVHAPGTYFDVDFSSKKRRPRCGVRVKKGQLIGDFNLGSTIVLLFEAPPKFQFSFPPGTKVQYGQPLGQCGHKLGTGKGLNDLTET